jgi:ComF family protein
VKGAGQESAKYSLAMQVPPARMPNFPAVCEVCARWPSDTVCPDCQARHARWLPRCPSCALHLAPGLERCVRCIELPTGPLTEMAARVDYAHPWVGLVGRLKTDPAWAAPLARLMLQAPEAQRLLAQAHWLVPVPLDPTRLVQRGFNQAWELIRGLHKLAPGACLARHDLLDRTPSETLQHRLDRTQRLDNVQGVFHVPPHARTRLRRRRVLLIDDVATTGATLRSAAAALRDAGASDVSALVFARTPAPHPD